jgi:hypothetical protein
MIVVGIMMTSLNAGGINMKNSLEKFGWNCTILGLGQKWQGWITRMKLYSEFAKSQSSDTIVVFVDAYDALTVRNSEGFQALFESFNSDIVVGAEFDCGGNCVPVTNWWSVHKDINNTNGNLYVQGGCIVGRAHALAKMYDWCIDMKFCDDQIGIAHFINNHSQSNIFLDYNNKFAFHDNFGSTGKFSINESNIIVAERGSLLTEPYFIHFPSFLIWRSYPLVHISKIPELKNYDFVGKHVLQNDFVSIGQVESNTVTTGNIVLLTILIALIVMCIIFICTCIHLKIKIIKTQKKQLCNE